jgi:hypothetical protein
MLRWQGIFCHHLPHYLLKYIKIFMTKIGFAKFRVFFYKPPSTISHQPSADV